MAKIQGIRLLNAVVNGTTSGAQMQTLLADSTRLAAFTALLSDMPKQIARMAASSTAMTAVAASSTAMAAVAASSTAMTAVWASNTATDAVFASATARLAVYNADTALAALQANPTQVQRKVDSGATLSSNSLIGAITLVANGTKIIILRRYYQYAEYDYINWARGSTTSGADNGPVAGSGGRTLYNADYSARGCVSGTYTDNGIAPQTNDATGNFVCAANGLRRNIANTGGYQYVYYIPV